VIAPGATEQPGDGQKDLDRQDDGGNDQNQPHDRQEQDVQ
jgi:hypothetical protein